MKLVSLLLGSCFCLLLASPVSSSGQTPLHYAFAGSFPTQITPKDGDGFRAQGIAVDSLGRVCVTAKVEGIVEFDTHGKYRCSFGNLDPAEEQVGVDQNGNPETGNDMPLGQRAAMRSADGHPFVVMPDAKTMSIRGHLFDPRGIGVSADGLISTIDAMTGYFQAFTEKGPTVFLRVPTPGVSFQTFTAFAAGAVAGPSGKPAFTVFMLNPGARSISILDNQMELVKTFGPATGPGQLTHPTSLAMNASKTLLFVGDGTRVMVFRTDGTFLYAFGSAGDKPGQFAAITALACSKAGHVFVLEGGRLQVFTEQGISLGQAAGREGSGGRETARLGYADAVAVDASETAYVVDQDFVKVYRRVS